ncbi:MAG: response regulator transcription factor [Ruminococcus sp.]|nr:response regulator transcription factor [Ruminococcus sp.]
MIKKVALIDGRNSMVSRYAEGLEGISFELAEDAAVPANCDCVLISQEYAGERFAGMAKKLREQSYPVAAVTFGGSCENQEALLEAGADDVLVLPMSGKLLERRINALSGGTALLGDDIDFSAFDRIADTNKGAGSFIVQENDFTNIYRFVLRVLERLDKHAQLVIFNITCRGNSLIEPEVLHTFITVAQRCLRRGDISSVHGTQLFVMLMGTDSDGAQRAAKRIIETFYAHCDDDAYDITFEVREIKE